MNTPEIDDTVGGEKGVELGAESVCGVKTREGENVEEEEEEEDTDLERVGREDGGEGGGEGGGEDGGEDGGEGGGRGWGERGDKEQRLLMIHHIRK